MVEKKKKSKRPKKNWKGENALAESRNFDYCSTSPIKFRPNYEPLLREEINEHQPIILLLIRLRASFNAIL